MPVTNKDSFGNYSPELSPADGIAFLAPGSEQVVYYTSNPNTENLTPANTQAAAVAYSKNGSGSVFGWDVDSQTWK